LATWVNLSNTNNVLEIGTGSGVIALMLAQRNSAASFTGIDISESAVELAQENLDSYPISSDIQFIHSSLQDFEADQQFDVIVSNPPFFENSTKSPFELKNATRHTDNLSLTDLLTHSKRLLNPNGVINLVYPVRYLDDLKAICKSLNLYPTLIVFTRSTSNKPIKRVLVRIGKHPFPVQEKELIINGTNKGYSSEVFEMLQPFLAKL
jgi:tRNA1Val (adenine37-N6)-methyltransferase